jgi:hypothetical protein
MDHFAYRNRTLHCEEIPVADLAAKYGTPLYVYSKATLLHHLKSIQTAFAELAPLMSEIRPTISRTISMTRITTIDNLLPGPCPSPRGE